MWMYHVTVSRFSATNMLQLLLELPQVALKLNHTQLSQLARSPAFARQLSSAWKSHVACDEHTLLRMCPYRRGNGCRIQRVWVHPPCCIAIACSGILHTPT